MHLTMNLFKYLPFMILSKFIFFCFSVFVTFSIHSLGSCEFCFRAFSSSELRFSAIWFKLGLVFMSFRYIAFSVLLSSQRFYFSKFCFLWILFTVYIGLCLFENSKLQILYLNTSDVSSIHIMVMIGIKSLKMQTYFFMLTFVHPWEIEILTWQFPHH